MGVEDDFVGEQCLDLVVREARLTEHLGGVLTEPGGGPIVRISPMIGCSSSAIMSRAMTCGSLSVSSKVSTGPQGTPASSTRLIHSSVVRVVVIASISRSSSSMLAIRSGSVAKRGSVAHSGFSRAVSSRSQSRSLAAPMVT